jgi:hypothetical protein
VAALMLLDCRAATRQATEACLSSRPSMHCHQASPQAAACACQRRCTLMRWRQQAAAAVSRPPGRCCGRRGRWQQPPAQDLPAPSPLECLLWVRNALFVELH